MTDTLMERVAGMSVAQLRTTIERAGGSHTEIVEKGELRLRALEALRISSRLSGIGRIWDDDHCSSHALVDADDVADEDDDDILIATASGVGLIRRTGVREKGKTRAEMIMLLPIIIRKKRT